MRTVVHQPLIFMGLSTHRGITSNCLSKVGGNRRVSSHRHQGKDARREPLGVRETFRDDRVIAVWLSPLV